MKNWLTTSMILLVAVIVCLPAFAQSPQISTDKSAYLQGEKIQVKFSGAPGYAKDWICIAPKSLPDNQAGDYDWIPQGATQGQLTFTAPPPGEYEARAYYNYSRNGYLVSARCVFSVANREGGQNPYMERVIDAKNPNEVNLPSDKGLVYILNRSIPTFANREIQVKANEKAVVGLSPGEYFSYPSLGGTILFAIDTYIERDPSGQRVESKISRPVELKVDVKPRHAYYISLTSTPMGVGGFTLDQISHEEGANSIKVDRMTLVK